MTAIEALATLLIRNPSPPSLPFEIAATAVNNDVNRHEEMQYVDFFQERARLAEHLDSITQQLAAMSALWAERDLPGDVLTEDVYPFHLSLDEMTAEVQNAAEMIRDRNLVWGA